MKRKEECYEENETISIRSVGGGSGLYLSGLFREQPEIIRAGEQCHGPGDENRRGKCFPIIFFHEDSKKRRKLTCIQVNRVEKKNPVQMKVMGLD